VSAFLDERYFDWLYAQVCSVELKSLSKTYRNLLHILYTKEFLWLIPNHDNRGEDGKSLRYEFLNDEEIDLTPKDEEWLILGCSFLELMVALARRLTFEADKDESTWFWEMMENLGLNGLNDRELINRQDVEDVLDRVTWRTYEYNGGGGLFPLVYPESDQREVEIWYQLSAYVLERSGM
jgi:hypothetical protein